MSVQVYDESTDMWYTFDSEDQRDAYYNLDKEVNDDDTESRVTD